MNRTEVMSVVDFALVHRQPENVERHHRGQTECPPRAHPERPQNDQPHVGDCQGAGEGGVGQELEREERVEGDGLPGGEWKTGQNALCPADDSRATGSAAPTRNTIRKIARLYAQPRSLVATESARSHPISIGGLVRGEICVLRTREPGSVLEAGRRSRSLAHAITVGAVPDPLRARDLRPGRQAPDLDRAHVGEPAGGVGRDLGELDPDGEPASGPARLQHVVLLPPRGRRRAGHRDREPVELPRRILKSGPSGRPGSRHSRRSGTARLEGAG